MNIVIRQSHASLFCLDTVIVSPLTVRLTCILKRLQDGANEELMNSSLLYKNGDGGGVIFREKVNDIGM